MPAAADKSSVQVVEVDPRGGGGGYAAEAAADEEADEEAEEAADEAAHPFCISHDGALTLRAGAFLPPDGTCAPGCERFRTAWSCAPAELPCTPSAAKASWLGGSWPLLGDSAAGRGCWGGAGAIVATSVWQAEDDAAPAGEAPLLR